MEQLPKSSSPERAEARETALKNIEQQVPLEQQIVAAVKDSQAAQAAILEAERTGVSAEEIGRLQNAANIANSELNKIKQDQDSYNGESSVEALAFMETAKLDFFKKMASLRAAYQSGEKALQSAQDESESHFVELHRKVSKIEITFQDFDREILSLQPAYLFLEIEDQQKMKAPLAAVIKKIENFRGPVFSNDSRLPNMEGTMQLAYRYALDTINTVGKKMQQDGKDPKMDMPGKYCGLDEARRPIAEDKWDEVDEVFLKDPKRVILETLSELRKGDSVGNLQPIVRESLTASIVLLAKKYNEDPGPDREVDVDDEYADLDDVKAKNENLEKYKRRILPYLKPFLVLRASIAERRWQKELQTRTIEPTINFLTNAFPAMDKETLQKRARAVKTIRIDTAGQVTALRKGSNGTWLSRERQIHVSLRIVEKKGVYGEKVMRHETLHALSTSADDKARLNVSNVKGADHLTEALVEELTQLQMAEKDSVEASSYSKQRQMLKSLQQLCRTLNEKIVPLDVFVEALFSEDKDVEKTLRKNGYSDDDFQKIQQFLVDEYKKLEDSKTPSEEACV